MYTNTAGPLGWPETLAWKPPAGCGSQTWAFGWALPLTGFMQPKEGFPNPLQDCHGGVVNAKGLSTPLLLPKHLGTATIVNPHLEMETISSGQKRMHIPATI